MDILRIDLLPGMKGVAEREGARAPAWRAEALTARYDRLVAEGQDAQPPPDVPPSACRQARSLPRRPVSRREGVLRFVSDPSVASDNNLAERDLRVVKLRQKASGCFGAGEGARRFCRIRGYVPAARERGRGVLHALGGARKGEPPGVGKRTG